MADVNEKRFTNVRIQHRTKTSAEWLAFTEAPLKGELCVELNVSEAGSAVSTKIKIGDGHTLFKDLAYVDGKDGYTPVKGKDYFTETDKAEFVASVIASLPVYGGEVENV